MWKFLFLAAVGFFLWKMFVGDWKQKAKEQKEHAKQEPLVAKGEMVKDPICGAFVSMDDAKRVRQGDQLTYFFSDQCRDEYLKRLEAGHGEDSKG